MEIDDSLRIIITIAITGLQVSQVIPVTTLRETWLTSTVSACFRLMVSGNGMTYHLTSVLTIPDGSLISASMKTPHPLAALKIKNNAANFFQIS